jgi:histidine triad (HIT) family protein
VADSADCLFCGIVAGTVPGERVATSERAIAFRDVAPVAPTHILVVPKTHVADVVALAETDPLVLADVYGLAARVASEAGLTDHRMVTNTGADAGQSVFHLHVHVLGGRSFGWPPG